MKLVQFVFLVFWYIWYICCTCFARSRDDFNSSHRQVKRMTFPGVNYAISPFLFPCEREGLIFPARHLEMRERERERKKSREVSLFLFISALGDELVNLRAVRKSMTRGPRIKWTETKTEWSSVFVRERTETERERESEKEREREREELRPHLLTPDQELVFIWSPSTSQWAPMGKA